MWTKTAVNLTASSENPQWHYAQVWKTGGGPIGYCAEHEPHPTETEARECYARYLRDNVRLDATFGDWTGCEVCDAPTKQGATVPGTIRSAALCDEHRDHDTACRLLGLNEPAGDSYGS